MVRACQFHPSRAWTKPRFKCRTVDAFNWVEFNPSTLARRLKRTFDLIRLRRIIRPSQTRYTSSVRLRFIRRTNDETNHCRTVDELIRCDNCSSFKTGSAQLTNSFDATTVRRLKRGLHSASSRRFEDVRMLRVSSCLQKEDGVENTLAVGTTDYSFSLFCVMTFLFESRV